ncbi:MAG: exonuclease, partial [Xenococcaceae cyanobacterium]
MREKLKSHPNPFSSNRVDTPFQQHPDLQVVYEEEFENLKSALLDIKQDKNNQSKGAVVIGEPGSGKTHLMMRLAREFLQTNRLLFIRHPNNPKTVLFHIYSRILESLVEPVLDTPYTQLEHFLAHSMVNFLQSEQDKLTSPGQEMLKKLEDDHLSIFKVLGRDGTKVKRDNWQRIEKWLSEWWSRKYGGAGYSLNIIRGIVKYCRYTDTQYKLLVTNWLTAHELSESDLRKIKLNNWAEDLSREAFALEAISVFSKLSLLDEPLIIVFDQLEGLGLEHNHNILLSFGEAVKEIFTHVSNSLIILNLFPQRWKEFQNIFDGSVVERVSQYIIQLEQPDEDKLKQILTLKLKPLKIPLEKIFTNRDLDDIFNQSSIRATINRAAAYYRLKVNGISLPPVHKTQEPPKDEKNTQNRLQYIEDELTKLKRKVEIIFEFNNLEISQEKTDIPINYTEKLDSPPITTKNPDKDIVISYLEQEEL